MTFHKQNKLGFLPQDEVALDRIPLQVKVKVGVRERIKAIPDWQNRLREKLDQWVQECEHNNEFKRIN